MKQCLVTGASGLIGSHLIPFLQNDYVVHGVYRGTMDILGYDQCQHIPIDFSHPWTQDLLPRDIDTIIHLSQSENFRHFPEKAEDIFQVNTVSTLRLLDYARTTGVKTFIVASSGGVYGCGDESFSEDKPIHASDDLGFYLGTRLCSEILAANYNDFMNIIILRFFFVYGPGQKMNMLIPRLVDSIKTKKPISLKGRKGIYINPIYVKDAVAAIGKAMKLDCSHKINVAGPEVLSLRKICEQIGAFIGEQPVFNCTDINREEYLIGNTEKMNRLLGIVGIPFNQGIKNYINSLNV